MKILYCAIDQVVPGTNGGSVHVRAVADGLAARGHEVHVLTSEGVGGFPAGPAAWHAMTPPLGVKQLRLARLAAVRAAAVRLRPDVVLERYYNFGGEGIHAAACLNLPGVLEVNAPVIDHPGSLKRALDRVLLVEPMRRWRDWQCRTARLIVTPSTAIVPGWVPREKVLQVEWGADVERFRPDAAGDVPFRRRPRETIAVFAGAFRAWHGAVKLVEAVGLLRRQGQDDITAVLIGDGPERPKAEAAARGIAGICFTGSLPHEGMPAALAAADIGVAPFDVAAHPPLSLAFYWSPLKVFEYMASGLPVVAPDIDGMRRLVEPGKEAELYDANDPAGLARALSSLADVERRRRLGAAARARVVRDFSWAAHCQRLEAGIIQAVSREPGPGSERASRTRP